MRGSVSTDFFKFFSGGGNQNKKTTRGLFRLFFEVCIMG